ncbi:aldehyde dehydrogenase family protein [Allobranchiibius sp. GilTou73]|uniref:aldehyde dehydrogenase family protein n=1 Tax=Allobranchiibius sp. GilTou73 TaxID=2904523 RepID=UPI001F35C555|nr:aldehyde dehydrogenase family protein [Allobranchiibius sp. GilTou73]UIJ33789.1 aldehyde dehydrogenase family protein [Allobranchiibius sp. GilTou73]
MPFFDADDWAGKISSSGWRAGAGGTADVREPATGEVIGSVGVATARDVDDAVTAATKAQKEWAALPYDQRAAALRRAATLIEEHAGELSDWLVREAGSGKGKAGFEASLVAAEYWTGAATVEAPYGQLLRTRAPRLSMARRVPAGVVGVISPFNFPQILSSRSVAPALATGNAVILKPDPRTAVSGGLFLAAILAEAGLPDGLVHVLPGAADVGTALVEHPGVRIISFTGSTAAGRKVGEAAGRLLKRAHLELGGNNALIVMDDVDVPAAVAAGAWGSFLHQGQICMTTGRHIVHEAIYDEYVERLAHSAAGIQVADPAATDAPLGPIIDVRQRDHVHDLVTRSTQAGARLVEGGTYEDLFYRPTVIADCSVDHPAFNEEVFGPVAPVAKFSSVEEAVELASRTEYGLSLGILTQDVMRGLALADRVPTGIVHINDQTVDDEAVAPFGGTAASGTGARFGGVEANIEAFTETQWVTMQSRIPQYPF